jgi:hypothetical protein
MQAQLAEQVLSHFGLRDVPLVERRGEPSLGQLR